jgi:Ca2+-binding EF-hand superfamily protein
MGAAPAKEEEQLHGFSIKEVNNLRQVYFYLCLHTTTLTSCQLDQSQFDAIFGLKPGAPRGHWRTLFTAIDTKQDGVIDFEEFLTFVSQLKRGDVSDRRLLVFHLLDANWDGAVNLADCQRVSEMRRSPGEVQLVFNLIDDDYDGVFDLVDFERYCADYGDTFVTQTLKAVELAFDDVIRETGILITSSDVRNTKPHIDWQDHKIDVYSYLCCSPAPPPNFSKAPPTW